MGHTPLRRIEVLEAIRGIAALYVAMGHLVLRVFLPDSGLLRFPFQFGQEAVIVFFLLSGFVIELSAGRRWHGASDYLRRRAVRIYPSYLFALLSAFVAVGIFERNWNPESMHLLGNVLMLQDFEAGKPGVLVATYKGDSALWSLSYEWWFYLLYIPFRRRPRATLEIGLLSLFATVAYLAHPFGPFLYLSYFPLWWAGVSLAREWRDFGQLTFGAQADSLVSIGTVGAIFAGAALLAPRPFNPGLHPLLEVRHLLCACAFILLAVVAWRRKWHRAFGRFIAPFASLGAVSYAFYVLHIPFVVYGATRSLPLLLLRCVLLVGACLWLERVIQPVLNRLLIKHRISETESLTPA